MLMTIARLIRFGLEVIAAEPLHVLWSGLVHGTIWVEILSGLAAFVLMALFRSSARSWGLRSAALRWRTITVVDDYGRIKEGKIATRNNDVYFLILKR
jgi:hypothetical protein